MVELTQTVEVDLDAMDTDELLDKLIDIRSAMAKLKAADAAILDRLDRLHEAGEIDATFSHNDWSFGWSAGRRSWSYPEPVQALEGQLRAARKAAEADGSAVATTGAPFWTIRAPKP